MSVQLEWRIPHTPQWALAVAAFKGVCFNIESCWNTFVLFFSSFRYCSVLQVHREALVFVREIFDKSDQVRFLSADCSANLKKSGLILAKASATEGLHPLDLSTLLGPSLPRFLRTHLRFPFLVPSLVYFCLRALPKTRNTNPVGRICVFTSMFPAGEQRHKMRYSHWYQWRIRSIDTKLYWRRQKLTKSCKKGGGKSRLIL